SSTSTPSRTPGISNRSAKRAIIGSTGEYPTPASRPAWSVLNSGRLREAFGLALPPWREQLALCLGHDA
ncbi:MAG TPA: sugar nucleotide-binding protein, partial [Gemmatimonadaceae bacterium]